MKRAMNALFLLMFSLMNLGEVGAATKDDVLGVWINQAGDGLIEISQQQGKISGIIKGSPDGKNRKDINNPDAALRDRSLQGVKILGGLSYRENNVWSGGWVYDPNNGKTYKCKMKLIDSKTLEIRGYVGVSIFGRTETWVKNEKTK